MSASWNVWCAVGLLSVMAFLACDKQTPAPRRRSAADVRVLPNPVVLPAGGGTQLSAEIIDSAGQPIGGAGITFTSSDPTKLSVSPTGLVRSEGPPGQADVVVSSGTKQTRVPVTVTAGPARTIEPVAGEEQSALVGAPLPASIVVRVLDGKSNPVSGAEVSFASVDGGIADPPEEVTNAGGQASTRWTLGPVAGVQRLSASIKGARAAARFTAHAESGPPAKLAELEGAPAPMAPGESRTLVVRVADAQNNPEKNITIHWRVEAGGGRLSSETSTSDETGVARVIFSAGKRSGLNRIAASTGALVSRIEVRAK